MNIKFKHPHRYGVMLMVRKEDYTYLNKYKNKLNPYVEVYMEKETVKGIAPQHISLCYFSYEDKYSKSYVKKLVPKIKKISEKYMPLKIKVKGLSGAWESGSDFPLVMWNILNFDKLNMFHKDIINALKEYIEHFNDQELDFDPHIGIALGKQKDIEKLKIIVDESKKDKEIELTFDRINIFFPEGPEEVINLK